MHILIVNDDGIESYGVHALLLEITARHPDWTVRVCCPDGERSGYSHLITYGRLSATVRKFVNPVYAHVPAIACSGTPADCVNLGLHDAAFAQTEFPPKDKVDVVVSGINVGENCGLHAIYSGTVAGAREACMQSVPGIAVSQTLLFNVKVDAEYFSASAHVAISMLEKLKEMSFDWTEFYLNINVPTCPLSEIKGVKLCSQAKTDYRVWRRAQWTQGDFVEANSPDLPKTGRPLSQPVITTLPNKPVGIFGGKISLTADVQAHNSEDDANPVVANQMPHPVAPRLMHDELSPRVLAVSDIVALKDRYVSVVPMCLYNDSAVVLRPPLTSCLQSVCETWSSAVVEH